MQASLCFCIQVALCALLIHEITSNKEDNGFSDWPLVVIVFARFTCGFALHMAMRPEMISGMNHMKLVINHPYRFQSPLESFSLGFMQATSSILIEVVNLFVILQSNTILDVVMNFMALAVIADFDNFFFAAQTKNLMNSIIDSADDNPYRKLYIVTRTTSNRADAVIDEH